MGSLKDSIIDMLIYIKRYIQSKRSLYKFNRDLPFGKLSLLEKMEKMMESKVS